VVVVKASRGERNNSAVQQFVPLGLTLLPVEEFLQADGCDRALHGFEFGVLATGSGTPMVPESAKRGAFGTAVLEAARSGRRRVST
jgi:hypothetical protein